MNSKIDGYANSCKIEIEENFKKSSEVIKFCGCEESRI